MHSGLVSKRRDSRTVWAAIVITLLATLAVAAWLVPRSSGANAETAAGSTPQPTSSTALHLVGFGDSVLAGAGCSCDDYLTQAANRLRDASGLHVSTTNLGVNGETAADLLHDLRTDTKAIAAIKQADVVVLTIGANDLQDSLDTWDEKGCDKACYEPEIDSMAQRLGASLAIIDEAKKPGAAVLVTTYWNVYLDGDVGEHEYGAGYLSWSDQVTKDANSAICQAAKDGQATCVDLYHPFKGNGDDDPTKLLADDGDHANARGTATISRVVETAVAQALSITPAH